MNLIYYFHDALLNLAASKLRSFLALLGILVGTASVVAMVLGGEIATNEVLKQFKLLGTDLLSVSINYAQSQDGKNKNINLADVNSLKNLYSSIVLAAPYTQVYQPVQYLGQNIDSGVSGVTGDLQGVAKLKLLKGRFISDLDHNALFCVIGKNVYDNLKKINIKDPLNQLIKIGSTYFTIVGIMESLPQNSFIYLNIDNEILIPIESSFEMSQYAQINNILFQLKPNANIELIKTNLKTFFNDKTANNGLYIHSAEELINRMTKQNNILTVLLGLVGGISLLVGGIGVMNIMLVSVMERRKEIGIRLAVGATQKDIRTLFLMEAIFLSSMGGMLGVVLGLMIAYIISEIWHWQFVFYFMPPLIGFSISTAIGIFFGFYPAYKASRLSPIEALRTD